MRHRYQISQIYFTVNGLHVEACIVWLSSKIILKIDLKLQLSVSMVIQWVKLWSQVPNFLWSYVISKYSCSNQFCVISFFYIVRLLFLIWEENHQLPSETKVDQLLLSAEHWRPLIAHPRGGAGFSLNWHLKTCKEEHEGPIVATTTSW